MEDIENLITNEELVNSSVCSYYNVEEGTYKILFDKYDICYLFDNDDLIYELNDTKSYLILRKIKDLNLNSEVINISDHNYLDYNVKLICKININIKEIFIQIPNEKLIFIDKINITLNLKPNTKYVISGFTRLSNCSIIISEGHKYYVNDKVINTLEKYFKCKDNKITCIYDGKEEIPKLTLITENEESFNKYNKNITILHQSLKMKIGKRKFNFYINNSEFIDYKVNDKYFFTVMNINRRLENDGLTAFGYDITKGKYYYFNKYADLFWKNHDPKIEDIIKSRKPIQNLYTYLLEDNEKLGIIVEYNDKKRTIYYGILNDDCFETVLDVSLLQENKPRIIDDDNIAIDFENAEEYYDENGDINNDGENNTDDNASIIDLSQY